MTLKHFGGVEDTKKWNMAQNMVKKRDKLGTFDTYDNNKKNL